MPVIYLDEGPARGNGFILPATHPHIAGYLASFTDKALVLAEVLSAQHAVIAVLERLYIPDEERRGEGWGNKLMEQFKARCRDEKATAILLVADVYEEQRAGFDLEAWYQRKGFDVVLWTNAGPLYTYPREVAASLVAATDVEH